MQGAAARPAMGIDLGGTKIEAVVLGDGGDPANGAIDGEGCAGARNGTLWRERVAAPAGDYAATLGAVVGLVGRARQALGPRAAAGLSIGIGTPGSETAAGRMKNCNSTCLNGQQLRADLQAALGQPIALANDANCLALSEATDGAGAGAAVVFAGILGTGAGAGIAVHGHVLTGLNGLAGEWGHNPLPWVQDMDLPLPGCYCEQQGCIETYVSGSGLAADHLRVNGQPTNGRTTSGQPLNGEAIVAAAAAGDAAARATLQRHTHRLARALASVINLLDPDVIVLGGGLSRLQHLYVDVPALWGLWVFSGGTQGREPVRTRLVPALHGDASGVRGAAWLGRSAQRAMQATRGEALP